MNPAIDKVLAALDDVRESAPLVELSAALAQQRRLALELVYVESVPALRAAALPFTQVLAHAGAGWSAFATADVERGFRAQVSRLETLASRVAARHAVAWTLRRMRAALPDAALALSQQASLLLVAPAGAPARSSGRLREVAVALTARDSALDQRCLQAAHDAAAAAQVRRVAAADLPQLRCDLLVLPQLLADRQLLAATRVPLLLVA